MTTFQRKNPVNPGYHMVTRNNWGRSSYAGLNGRGLSDWVVRYLKSHDFEDTRRYFDENATCPECGDSVYFFRHENGGCVWFDEIPWPWTRHPCMDLESTKASTQSYNAALKKRQQESEARDYAKTYRKGSFAGLFFKRNHCWECQQSEFVFELTNGAVTRFKEIGDKWIEADCNRSDEGHLYRAPGYEYLENFLDNGGNWKPRSPEPISHKRFYDGAPYHNDMRTLARRYLHTPFAVDSEALAAVIPCEHIAHFRAEGGSWLYFLSSVLYPEAQLIVRGGNSSALCLADFAFLKIKKKSDAVCDLAYLCLDSGKARKLSIQIESWCSLKCVPAWDGAVYPPRKEDAVNILENFTTMPTR